MRCRCFLCNSDAMSMVFGHSYHRNRYDYFCSTIGTDYFPMFFSNLRTDVWRWFFVGKPKNSVYYDMLKFATYCAYISALGVKNIKTKGKQCLWRLNNLGLIRHFCDWLRHFQANNLWLDYLTSALGSNKGRQITTIVKEWWFSMSQSQSVRLFLLNHWDRLFSDGFQITNNR